MSDLAVRTGTKNGTEKKSHRSTMEFRKKDEAKRLDELERTKEEVQVATNFAFEAHAGQFRKNVPLPYIVHPLQVLALLAEWGVVDSVTWKAAINHDVREENNKISKHDVEAAIGKEAAFVVEELSFFPDEKSNVPVPDQKAAYLRTFMTKKIESVVVKVADRCRNTLDFLQSDPTYAAKYWRKGEPIMEAMLSRSLEIVAKYGEGVFACMKFCRDSISRQVVR